VNPRGGYQGEAHENERARGRRFGQRRSSAYRDQITAMVEETLIAPLTQGHQFDGGLFALDVYRLLGIVLSDKQIAALGDEATHHSPPVWQLQDRFRKAEIMRILISSAVALRILLDQERDPRDKRFKIASNKQCGELWKNWDRTKRRSKGKSKPLTVRDACNKIIHASDIVDDVVWPNPELNPDQVGIYIRPFVYLYGTHKGQDWRAKLSVIDFAQRAAGLFLIYMPP
jgi:hypothetical protein